MKVAVIGIGKMGMLHAGILNALDGTTLCAISDSSPHILKMARNLKSIATCDDYVAMLDQEKPDAAVIATPIFLHVPMALHCARRGIPFFVEKPLSLTAAEAGPLLEEVRRRRLITYVGYMLRHVDTFERGRAVVASGALGKLTAFSSTAYVSQLFKKGKGWRYSRKQAGGGVLMGQGTHLIDLLLWYLGPVAWVTGHTRSLYSEEVEDAAHIHFEFESGVTGWMDSSWSMRDHRLLETTVLIQGESGQLEVSDDVFKLYLDRSAGDFAAGWTEFKKPELFCPVPIDIGGPHYTREIMAFVEAVRSQRPPESDIESAFRVQEVVDAVYRSAERHGEPMRL